MKSAFLCSPRLPVACSLLLILMACRSTAPLPPADLSQPDWRVRHGQAVWHTQEGGPELAGELTFATHPDGSVLLEFSKIPLPIVVGHFTPSAWRLNYVAEGRTYGGRGVAPPRSAWLVLPDCLAGRPIPQGWKWTLLAPDHWRLEQPRTGEQLRGYLRP